MHPNAFVSNCVRLLSVDKCSFACINATRIDQIVDSLEERICELVQSWMSATVVNKSVVSWGLDTRYSLGTINA